MMNVYKYYCAYCGEVETSLVHHGTRFICGKCRHSKVLVDADKFTDLKQLGL